jgi:plasmid replication initiation protein
MSRKKVEKTVRLVTKSNKLIEARHDFDIWELRIFTKMLMLIGEKDMHLDYIIPIKDIIADFELSDSERTYVALREAADKLLGRKVYIYKHIEAERWERQATTLIKTYTVPVMKTATGKFVEITDKTNYIRIGFDEDVRNLIVDYKNNFTRLNLNVLTKLSPKSFRMYELLKQYEDTGFRTIVVEDLREIFDLTGQYNLYGSIKQRIIDKAQRDLEEHADITFTYDEIKQGRAVNRINFHIRSKNVLKLSSAEKSDIGGGTPQYIAPSDSPKSGKTDTEPILPEFYDEIAEFAIKHWEVNAPVLKKLMAEFPIERLRQAVEVTKQALQRGKIKGKIAGFFVEAARSGYTVSPEIPQKGIVQEAKKVKNPKAIADEAATEAAQISHANQKKQAYELEKQAILESLKTQPQLTENILEEIKRGMFSSFWNADLSFEENLEKPAFYGLVATLYKKISA